jgi:ABC-2 type transport system permease protein
MTGETRAMRRQDSHGRRRKRVPTRPDQQSRQPAERAEPSVEVPRELRGGWRVIAAKEFTDHILSWRFLILTILVGLAAAAAVYSTAGNIKDVASQASGTPSLFLYLFFYQPSSGGALPTFVFFVTLLGPLLGIAFGFDAINGERVEGTLPRLISQPVHRDDIINGKFVAGLSAIGVAFVAIAAVVAAVGILQLGILPAPDDIARLIVWVILAIVYVGVWMALALLCSVVFRRAATSAIAAISIWLLLTLFASLLVQLIVGAIAPLPTNPSVDQQVANVTLQSNLARLSPTELFTEATQAVLNPTIQTFDISSLLRLNVEPRAIGSVLSLDQSLLVVWPQVVTLVAVMAVLFALAYVSFMRQEVRA